MAFSKEFTDQMRAIGELVENVTDMKVKTKMQATFCVQVKMLEMMTQKGLITAEDIDAFIREVETAAAAMSKTTPEMGSDMADLALQLRSVIIKSKGKPN